MKSLTFQSVFLRLFFVTVFALLGCENNSTHHAVKSVKDLGGARVGVQIGTTADIYASEYGGDTNAIFIERYTKTADAIQALRQGKLDAVMVDDKPAHAFVENNKTLAILDEAFVEETYAGVVSLSNKALLDSVNMALKELQESGIYQKILDTYIENKGDFNYTQRIKEGNPLVLATNAQFKPYEFHSKNGIIGIDIEVAYFVADFLGRVLEIQDIEFDAVINAVSSGKADIGFAGFTVTEERKKSISFTNPYALSKIVIVVPSENATEELVSFKEQFYKNFIKDSRWKFIVEGLCNTLLISFCAALLGIFIGFLVALVRIYHQMNGKCRVLNAICKVYLALIRGTPIMVQLLIIYYIVFSSVNVSKILVAIIAFGINSGAYVSEIIRAGLKAVDPGQFEAGKSLGLRFHTVLRVIVLPQALKNSLPALTNEFISLIKETSICGYIGLTDLTRGGDIIRSLTYEALFPLLSVAAIYFVIVAGLSAFVAKLERYLKKNER